MPVNLTGIKLLRFIDDKWENLPKLKSRLAYDDDDADFESDDSRDNSWWRTFFFFAYPTTN